MGNGKRVTLIAWFVAAAGVVTLASLGTLWARDHRIPAYFNTRGLVLAPAQTGGIKGWFLLDSGSETTVVTPDVGRRLKPTGESRKVSSATSGNDAIHALKVRSGGIRFASGSLQYPEHVDVVEFDRLAALLEHPVDGILGWDVLRNYVVGIDPRSGGLLAGRNVSALTVLTRLGGGRAGATLILETMGDRPFLEAQSGEHELKLMLDTGCTTTTLFTAAADRLGIVASDAPSSRVGWTITGEMPIHVGRLTELRLGPICITNVPVAVTMVPSATENKGSSLEPYDGLLGMDVLAQYVKVIDGPQGVLYLAE